MVISTIVNKSSNSEERIVYSRDQLIEIRHTMPESINTQPNINKYLEEEVVCMLFGDNSMRTWQPGPQSQPRYEWRRSGNWRNHGSSSWVPRQSSGRPPFLPRRPSSNSASPPLVPSRSSSTRATSQSNERGQERKIIIKRESVQPLRRSPNRFIPSCQREDDGLQNHQTFTKTLRSHLNKITNENSAVLTDKIINLMKHEYTGNDRVSTFTEMVLAKVVFDRGLCTEVYVKLCQSSLEKGQLNIFREALLKAARETLPRLKQTKEVMGATTFFAELVQQKVLSEVMLNEVVELFSQEDELQTVAKCHLVKTAKAENLPTICPKLYDSLAYSLAWNLTKPIAKRIKFLCEDAIKVARKNRSKPFRVIPEPIPDTVGMWFGRY